MPYHQSVPVSDYLLKEGLIGRRVALATMLPVCALVAFTVLAPVRFVTHAAELDNVPIPDTIQVNRKTLHLNGYGLRTYSLLAVHIYVASLYLEHLNTNPDEIINSPETKLLIVRFKQNVSSAEARNAWRDGLANNCLASCHLDPSDIEKFLAMVPGMHIGDSYAFLFQERGVTVTVGGQFVGTISSPQFAKTILAMFLGPRPASPRLKEDLLKGHG